MHIELHSDSIAASFITGIILEATYHTDYQEVLRGILFIIIAIVVLLPSGELPSDVRWFEFSTYPKFMTHGFPDNCDWCDSFLSIAHDLLTTELEIPCRKEEDLAIFSFACLCCCTCYTHPCDM